MIDTSAYPIPVIHPLPANKEGMILSLSDDCWQMCHSSFADSAEKTWEQVSVPSVQWNEGGTVTYRRMLSIPASWEKKRIFLRFDGANCFTRIYINGTFVMDHYGGFVSWDCELTHMNPGNTYELVVEIEARTQETSPFHYGGLMRDVLLYALPETCLARLHVHTAFDAIYQNAVLSITVMTEGDAQVHLSLVDPVGIHMPLGCISCTDREESQDHYPISRPRKWDSEHPWLYTLRAEVFVEGALVESVEKRIGFRQIERRGNEVYINGDLLKLRGINRHDIHPTQHRAITHEWVEKDVKLFREANINFIRTSHYTPRPDFLDLCDQYGIYVEDESAVAFLGYALPRTESDPTLERAFMQPFTEMVERDRDHPCIIIWSIANESYWGHNHALMQDYAHRVDPDRLTIFSYPMTQMEDDLPADIWSSHYDHWTYDLSSMSECFRRGESYAPPHPVLHDECTHICCYNLEELRRDPGVRDFWGESLWRFWERVWETKGALGCAIWCGVDDVMFDRGKMREMPWGIIDGWRRKKPEYWHVRKGYSPVKVEDRPFVQNGKWAIRVHNRFNHTNLNEISVHWTLEDQSGTAVFGYVPPRTEGTLILPLPEDARGLLSLTFTDSFGWQVEEEQFELVPSRTNLPTLSGVPRVIETPEAYILKGKASELCFSKETGLILYGLSHGHLVLTGGPFLNLVGLPLAPWKLNNMILQKERNCVAIILHGSYGQVQVSYTIRVDRNGLMETSYTITDMPYASPRRIAITSSITANSGGYSEVGIAFRIAAPLGKLNWQRQGRWSVYPDWHIGRNHGSAVRHQSEETCSLLDLPSVEWKDETRDWLVHGYSDIGMRGSRDFAASREGITRAALSSDQAAFSLFADENAAIRMQARSREEDIILPDDKRIHYTGSWKRLESNWRTLKGYEMVSRDTGDRCECIFEGTGIAWYASQDFTCGKANVYLDGELQASDVDLGLSAMGKNPRGKIRQYGQLIYGIEGLQRGKHVLCIEVCGKPALESHNSYVPIDHFLVLGNGWGDTLFIINQEINYPQLSWACYNKPPIIVESGYTGKVITMMSECPSD